MIRICLTAVMICQFFNCAISQSRAPGEVSDKGIELAERIRKFYRLYPREQAFLFTDNNVYLPGETVWYKLYLWNDDAAETRVSNVAHVVIRNNAGDVVFRQHVLVAANESHGDIALSDSLATGIYSIEVFTNWMLNFSSSPIAARALWISDGKRSIAAYGTDNFQPMIKPEGGHLSGDGSMNKIAVWSGSASGFTFQLIDPQGRSVFREQFTRPYAVINVSLSAPGVYQAKVCQANSSRCYEEKLTTSENIAIRLYAHMPLNKVQVGFNNKVPPGERWLLALTENSLVDMIRLPADRDSAILDLQTENYPEGIIHLAVVDDRHQLQSHRAFYHAREKVADVVQGEHIQKIMGGNSVQVKLARPATERFAAAIVPEGMRCSPFFLKYAEMDGHTRNDMMLFQPFNLEGALTKFLNSAYLPIVHSTHTPLNKRLDHIPAKGNAPDPLTMILSGLNHAGRADSIVAVKKNLAKIDATYFNNNTAPGYERIPADVVYVPREYSSMKGLLEFLRQAIPPLKFNSPHDHNAMAFLVSNLKGQKSLYPGKPAVTLNGYVVHDLNTIKDLPFSEITSIEILYQPQTLVEANLKNIFPYGVIAIYTSEAASVLTRTMTLGKRFFSGALSWPHVFEVRNIFPEGAGDRWPFFRSVYAWQPDLDFIGQKQLFLGEIPVQRPPKCILLVFSLAQVRKEVLTEVPID